MCKSLLLVAISSLITIPSGLLFAQGIQPEGAENLPPIPARLLHDFHNEANELIASGQFVRLESITVTIKNADYSLNSLKMKELSQQDKRWVTKQVALAKKAERLAQEAGQVSLTIDRSKPRTIIKACKKLKSFGRAALPQAAKIRALFNIDDDRAKLACLATYPYICKLDFRSLKEVVAVMNSNRNREREVVNENPQPFLDGIASMDYLGLVYLRHVAYSCELQAQPGWTENELDPIRLKFSKGDRNSLRRAAIKAIGRIRGEEATAVLLDLTPFVEEPINGKRDDKMLTALLQSFGKIGVNNGEVVAILQRHEDEFPKITEKSLTQIGEN